MAHCPASVRTLLRRTQNGKWLSRSKAFRDGRGHSNPVINLLDRIDRSPRRFAAVGATLLLGEHWRVFGCTAHCPGSPPELRIAKPGMNRLGRKHVLSKMNQRISYLLATCALLLALGFASTVQAAEADAPQPAVIQEINVVHFSHTDVGFTDHPDVCRELYRRYLDIALDTALDTMKGPAERRFFWTAEATMPVNDWWQAADSGRRQQFLSAVHAGQLEVTALACNNTPFMNAAQWQTMTHWLPEDLWTQVRPRVAVQDDVNGLPRAAALALLDRGVRHLFTGINEDSGEVPFPRPSAFWWKMPDGRRLFVWLNTGYGSGFDFFESAEWRRGPVPRAADTTYRPPRAGDILRSDEDSLRKAHRVCLEQVNRLERGGYSFPILTISITSQWRFDNDPPFPPLADFVAAWNKLNLQPRLRLTTIGDAMQRMEEVMGSKAPEYSGEWTDWWANGTASAPREVAASRAAKRFLTAANSSLWGPSTAGLRQTMDGLFRDLCLFDEHTWGSSLSVAKPFSLDTLGQFNEKSRLAWRPMARAEWLLSQRARTKLIGSEAGLFLANPSRAAFRGWTRLIATSLRDNYQSVADPMTGQSMKLYFEPGTQPWGRPVRPEDLSNEDVSATFPDQAPRQTAKFWVERLDANTVRHLVLNTNALESEPQPASAGPQIDFDATGWPKTVTWPGMNKPLFLEGLGRFAAVKVNGFAPRWALADIRGQRGSAREAMRADKLQEVAAATEAAQRQESPHTIVISQSVRHPRLAWGTRILEIWKDEPRVRLNLRLNRIASAAPEIFYLDFPLPTGQTLPQLSNGGVPFTPFSDQLSGTCRDYFAVDGWADYTTPDGHWLWVSRDVPLLAFGANPTLARQTAPPDDVYRLRAMLLNNFWYTNFLADEPVVMEFQFDLVWRENPNQPPDALAEALVTEPVVLINPSLTEDPRVLRDLFQP
jgi:hypothetical protein